MPEQISCSGAAKNGSVCPCNEPCQALPGCASWLGGKYLQQLHLVCLTQGMEKRIACCTKQAVFHVWPVQQTVTAVARKGEQTRAKMHLRDSQRIQAEYNKDL